MYALPVDEDCKSNLQATPTIESPTTGEHQAERFNWLYEWYSPGVVMLCCVVIIVHFFALFTSQTKKKKPDTALKSISLLEIVFSCIRYVCEISSTLSDGKPKFVDGGHILAFDIAFRWTSGVLFNSSLVVVFERYMYFVSTPLDRARVWGERTVPMVVLCWCLPFLCELVDTNLLIPNRQSALSVYFESGLFVVAGFVALVSTLSVKKSRYEKRKKNVIGLDWSKVGEI